MNNDPSKQTYSSVRINDDSPKESPKDIIENAFQQQENKIKQEEEQRQLEETLKKLSTEQIKVAEEEIQKREETKIELPKKKGPKPKSPFTKYTFAEKMEKEDRFSNGIKTILKMRKSAKVMIVLFLVIIVGSIGFFQYNKDFRNNPQAIMKKAVVSIGKEFLQIIRIPEEQTLIGDTFQIDGKATYSLQSERVMENYLTDNEMLKKYYLMNNLNKATTNYKVEQDKSKKKFFYHQKTSIQNKVVTEDKYLIDNSTEYYFVKEFMNKYINNGNKTYFESLTKDHNANDNIKYLYKLILNSISDNIEKEEYIVKNTTTIINGKISKVKEISLELDNKKTIEVLNKTIEDLKKDKRAFNILQGVYDDFEHYKIKKGKKILESNQKLQISIYTKGFFRDMKKTKVTLTDSKSTKGIEYEKEMNRITYLENNSPKYYLQYEITKDKVLATIQDQKEENIGKIEFDYNKVHPRYQMELEDTDKKIEINVSNKITKKKKDSYRSKIEIEMDIREEKKMVLKGTITFDSKVTNKPKIEEEIEDIIFKKELTNEQLEQLKNIRSNRLQSQIQ